MRAIAVWSYCLVSLSRALESLRRQIVVTLKDCLANVRDLETLADELKLGKSAWICPLSYAFL
jgi:uncharacterized protein Yka (UPF0111/DUF47 family)